MKFVFTEPWGEWKVWSSKVGLISPSPSRGRIETFKTRLLPKFEENLDE